MAGPDFPIAELLPGLLRSLAGHPRLVLEAPPGAGKTTQVPLALLEAPWRGDGRILMLEPRRVAARAAAGFMARQRGEAPGETVGYRIRFEAKVSARTRVEVVTEGILTRMVQDDPTLEGVAAVIFDEFHERHLAGDLGLALALDVQSQLRPDLRIVVMSATLDGERLAKTLDAPRLTSAGRSYVVFGKSSGTAVDLSAIAAGSGGFVINGQSIGDRRGTSVASTGELKGDELAYLILGAPRPPPPHPHDRSRRKPPRTPRPKPKRNLKLRGYQSTVSYPT